MTLTRRSVIFSAFMVSGAVAAERLRPDKHLTDVIGKPDLPSMFPTTIGGTWRLDDFTPAVITPPNVQAVLDSLYNAVLTRTYIRTTGERIMLSVAYGGDQSDATRAHRPEVCYPAQGFQILNDLTEKIDLSGRTMPVRNLLAKLGPRMEPITYWVVTGDVVVTSGTQQKLAQMRYGFRGLIPDGMLIRVSNINAEYSAGIRANDEFIRDLYKEMSPAARARVFGRDVQV